MKERRIIGAGVYSFILIFILIFNNKLKNENEELEHAVELIKYKIYSNNSAVSDSVRKILYTELDGSITSRVERSEMMNKILNDLNNEHKLHVEEIFCVESKSLYDSLIIREISNSELYTTKGNSSKYTELDRVILKEIYSYFAHSSFAHSSNIDEDDGVVPIKMGHIIKQFKIKEYDGKVFGYILYPFYYQKKLVKVHGLKLDLTKNLESLFERRNSFFKEAYYVGRNGLILGDIYIPIFKWNYLKNNDLKKIELDTSYKTLSIENDYFINYKLNIFSVMLYSLVIAIALSYIITVIMERLLEHNAKHNETYKKSLLDPLTNIYNRRGFFDFYKRNHQLNAIAIIDIDDFKKINDTYGHDAGDMVLVKISNLLQKAFLQCEGKCGKNEIFSSNNCCVRWGGEEFLVGMKYTYEEKFLNILERVRSEIKELIFEGFPDIKVTVSIGASVNHINSIDLFYKTFKVIDSNLYKAKKTGKDKIVFSDLIL